jgi:thiol-disulfide isomerase/thioredoxin
MRHLFRYIFGISFLTAAIAAGTHAQQPQKKLSWSDQFILDRSGKAFPIQDSFATLNGKVYNFRQSKRPAFVYISSESCLPCKFELPLYLDACKAYPGFDFVYFTTEEDSAAVLKKFGAQDKQPNLYIISRPYSYFYDNQLFMNFPTKYFIDSKRKVEIVQLGGYMVKEKVLDEWQPVLTHLQ